MDSRTMARGRLATRRRLRATLGGALVAAAVALPGAGVARAASGPVDVLYAGSLLDLVQQHLGPAFTQATGYSVQGYSAGSDALANEIKGGTQVGDVFLSASPSADAKLIGKANGSWVSDYAAFGTSALVLAYNPASRFASALRTTPWYTVVDRPGFRLGRTDPATDPKGALTVEALTGAALSFDQPKLLAIAKSSANVFPETTLVGRLQAGQLDAGFFYLVEARSAHLATVSLTGVKLAATYTVAVLNRAPHRFPPL